MTNVLFMSHVHAATSKVCIVSATCQRDTALAFTHLFHCLLRDAYCSNNLLLYFGAGASSGLHLDCKKKDLEETGRIKDRERGRVGDSLKGRQKERNILGKNDMAQRQGSH